MIDLKTSEHFALRDNTKASKAQRRYWFTYFALDRTWAEAYARGKRHNLVSLHKTVDTWLVFEIPRRTDRRRRYTVRAAGLRYRQLACGCPGARGGKQARGNLGVFA